MIDALAVKNEILDLYKIDGLSREVEVNRYDEVFNDFREPTKVFREQVVVNGVVRSYDSYQPVYDRGGKYGDAGFVIFLPVSFVVEESDVFLFDDKAFTIVDVVKKPLGDLLVHQRVFVKEDNTSLE